MSRLSHREQRIYLLKTKQLKLNSDCLNSVAQYAWLLRLYEHNKQQASMKAAVVPHRFKKETVLVQRSGDGIKNQLTLLLNTLLLRKAKFSLGNE